MASKRPTKRNKKPVIILGGLAGSGKSTTSALLAKRLKLRRVSAGDIFRALAKERKTDLIALGRYAERHPEFDRVIDGRILKEARKGGVILDGRASASLTQKARIPALRIFLAVDPAVSARRVSKRDGLTVAEARRKISLREREIKRRLTALYGLDTYGLSHYDVVIQTDGYSPEEVVQIIVKLVEYDRH